MSRRRAAASLSEVLSRALLLLLVTLVACWPTWSLPELDGTEGRRVQIALEMLRSGNWWVPSLGWQPTWAKPPLHYWILASCQQWLGDGVWAMRLPSVLGAFAAALLAAELWRRRSGPVTGWIAGLGIACSPMVVGVWPEAEIDPLFACFTATSLWCLACGVTDGQKGLLLASGLLGGLAMLQKGPPYFLFAAGAYWVWWQQRRCRACWWHFVPLLLVPLAYYLPLWWWHVAPGQMLAVANEESVGRVAFFEWKHVRAIPEFWLRAFAVTLPFGFWLLHAWRQARGDRQQPADLAVRMCLWAGMLAVVALTFFPGRPTRYLQPNVLLLAFALAPAVAGFVVRQPPLPGFAARTLAVVGIGGSLALVVLPFLPRVGVGAIGCAAAAAVGARLVRTPREVVAFCLVMPVIGAWTVGLDRSLAWPDSPRARQHGGDLLRAELATAGVVAAELTTMGHFDSPLLLAAGLLPPGDEFARGEWRSRWVLHEMAAPPLVAPAHFVARVRLDLPFKSFVLRERLGDGR